MLLRDVFGRLLTKAWKVDLLSHLPLVPMLSRPLKPRIEFLDRTLKECLSSHPECAEAQTAGWVPRRLVDINTLGHRLYLEENLPGWGVTYATLSHVWGPNSNIPGRLTAANHARYKDRSRGIVFWELPEGWRAAILKLRDLNVRYIWVDALW